MDIKPNQLVHVKVQGAMGQYKYLLLKLESTYEIKSAVEDMGYGDFKILDWKLIKVDVSNCVSYPISIPPFEENH